MIFQAKIHKNGVGRQKQDKLATRLAAQFNISPKAVRDIWCLRTWVHATRTHWTLADVQRYLQKQMCASCVSAGVLSMEKACSPCRYKMHLRRSRKALQTKEATIDDAMTEWIIEPDIIAQEFTALLEEWEQSSACREGNDPHFEIQAREGMAENESGGCAQESGATQEGLDVPFDDNADLIQDLLKRTTRRQKARACIPCRQLKKKCDYARPCSSCLVRKTEDSCQDEHKAAACSLCRNRRQKCDRQRPCSRCVQVGKGDTCASISYLSLDLRHIAGAPTLVPSDVPRGSTWDLGHSAVDSAAVLQVSSISHREERARVEMLFQTICQPRHGC